MNQSRINELEKIAKGKDFLIFDFDQTIAKIVIDWSDWRVGVVDIIKKYDPSFNLDDSIKVDHVLQDLIDKFGIQLHKETTDFMANYETTRHKAILPNIDLISFIKNSEKEMYVFSSNSDTLLKNALNKLNILSKFNKVISRNDVSKPKPSPDGFNKIYNSDFKKESYLMIGDSDNDQMAAEAFGIDYFKLVFLG